MAYTWIVQQFKPYQIGTHVCNECNSGDWCYDLKKFNATCKKHFCSSPDPSLCITRQGYKFVAATFTDNPSRANPTSPPVNVTCHYDWIGQGPPPNQEVGLNQTCGGSITCAKGLTCVNGVCKTDNGQVCKNNSDCTSGKCSGGICVDNTKGGGKLGWFWTIIIILGVIIILLLLFKFISGKKKTQTK